MRRRLLVIAALLAGCQAPAPTTAPAAAPAAPNAAGPRRYIDIGAQVPGLGVEACVLPGLLGKCPRPTPTPTPTPCVAKPYAVFTHSDRSLLHLAGLHMAGLSNRIEGDTHSNDQTWMAGTTSTITGRDEARAGWIIAGLNNNPGTQVKAPAKDFPAPVLARPDFGPATFSFTGDTDLKCHPEVWAAPGMLKPGIYQSTGKIIISDCNVTGNVTFVCTGLWMLGHKLNLTAYTRGVLAYVDGRCLLGKDVYFLGCESRFTGQFLAYNGEVLVAGDRNRVDGSIYSNTFDMIGLCNTIAAPATWSCDPAPTGAPSAPVPTTTPTPSAAPTAAPTPAPTPTPAPATPAPTPTPPGGGQPVDPTPGPGGTQGSGGPGQPSGSTWSINSGGNPFGLALDQDQNLWVTHCSAYVDVTRIHRASGATLNDVQVGYNGHELAFDANRRLTWLTINGDQLIYGLNADGSIAFRSSPGWKPEGVALDANGRAWVCDVGEGLVWQLDPTDGHALAAFSVGDWTTQPRGIAIDQAGHAWVTLYAAKQLVELAADGTVLGTFPTDTNPSKVAVDGQGNVWVTGTGADIPYPDGTQPGQVVMKFSSSGQRLGTFRVGDSPYGLAFDRQGNVLVVNTGTSNVTKLSPGGQVLATYPVGLHPYNVVVDREGYAWVSNFDDGTITKLVP